MDSVLTGNGLTAPYPAEVDERLRLSSVAHLMEFYLETGDFSFPLEYQGNVSLTFDENWAPYAQLSGSFKYLDARARTFMDPNLKEPAYIRVAAGYAYDFDKKYLADMAKLRLRTAVTSAPSMDNAVTAASSEAQLQDWLWSLESSPVIPTQNTKDALLWCLDQAGNREPFDYETEGTNVTLPDGGIEQGANLWDIARDIAASGKCWFYHDGLGQWRLRPRPLPVDNPRTRLEVGQQGTVISYQIGKSREDYADGVIVKHSWGSGDSQKMVGKAAVANPTRWRLVNRDTAITKEDANSEAKSLLDRFMGVRESIEIEAKAAYWLRPGHFVQVRLPGVDRVCRVSRVQFSFPAGRMSVRAVIPETEVEE